MTDLSNLLQPVSLETPCGENLEYTAGFLAMEQASRGRPERSVGDTLIEAEEPDWGDVRTRALELLGRTRDLRVAGLLTRALLHTDGLEGFAAGLGLIRGYLEKHWAEVHPLLDPEDGLDPTARVNAIRALADPEVTLGSLRRTPLVAAPLGRFNHRDFLAARGQIPPPAGESAPDFKVIESAFMSCRLEDLQARSHAVAGALESIAAIESFLVKETGSSQAPDMGPLSEALRSIQTVLNEYLARRGAAAAEGGAPGAVQAGANGGAGMLASNGINSREDAARALEAVAEYFARHEPSSPVPLLLRRARRLMSKDFLAIVRDLAPDGIKQVESIRGADADA